MKSVKQLATSFLSAACLANSALFAAEPATAAFNPDSVVKPVEKTLAPLKEQVAKEDLAYQNTRIFEVLAYGAIADGKTLNTQAIQKAIDACAAAGGGRVHFTKGDYLTGTIILKAGTVLDLDEGARILGSTKLADYPSTPDQFPALYQKMYTQSLIHAEKADGVGIRGKGELDMQGGSFPGHETVGGLPGRPFMIRMGSIRNIAFINITGERNGDIGCPVAGIPGHRIENVLFKNIALGVLGGGSKKDAARTPPELAANYPEGKMFGKLPAHGIYFRHVDGAVVENVRFKTKSNDARPAFAGSDVLNVTVDGTPLVGNPVTTPLSTDSGAPGHAISKPNVIIILADDLGYGDVKCYNPERGKIPTPHIDKLASQGMRFTDAHTSSGVCSPTRYALLTGRYHWRSHLQNGIVNYLEDPLIAPGRLTLASLLKQHGYRTGAIGKWHLGWDFQLTADERKRLKSYGGKWGGGGKVNTTATDEDRAAWRTIYARQFRGGPVTLGFDSYFGTDVPNWPPYCFIENDRTVGIPSELLAADALRKNQASLQGPALPGWKLEDVLPALEERACAFIQNAAKAPEPFFLYLPLTAPHTPIATTKEWRGKSGLNDYADFVMQTDATIGRVLQALEQSGAAENTLVVFTSDNGCAPYVGAAELEEKGHFPSGPLRGYKADAWEGGHRVPFIVRWPGNVKPDTRCDALVAQADLMATLAETLDAKLPDNAGEDSYSLMPLLKGGDKPVREYAISHAMSGLPSLRKGSWKIIFGQKGGGFGEAPGTAATGQLYDLATDLGETKNLWKEQPELVAELAATMTRLVADGRSTPGEKQQNDVPVRWQRFLERSSH